MCHRRNQLPTPQNKRIHPLRPPGYRTSQVLCWQRLIAVACVQSRLDPVKPAPPTRRPTATRCTPQPVRIDLIHAAGDDAAIGGTPSIIGNTLSR